MCVCRWQGNTGWPCTLAELLSVGNCRADHTWSQWGVEKVNLSIIPSHQGQQLKCCPSGIYKTTKYTDCNFLLTRSHGEYVFLEQGYFVKRRERSLIYRLVQRDLHKCLWCIYISSFILSALDRIGYLNIHSLCSEKIFIMYPLIYLFNYLPTTESTEIKIHSLII